MKGSGAMPAGCEIPGVKPADQVRSRKLQRRFAEAGRDMLLETRLKDLSIPQLAEHAGSSVGGFYSRFESKDAFFEFLRMQMLSEHLDLYKQRLAPEVFEGKDAGAVSAGLVDVMLEIFDGPWRGVLREAYSQIPDQPDRWAPMRERGRQVRDWAQTLYAPLLGADEGLPERLSFAVQMLFSALNNEMMNPHLPFGIGDPKFRVHLIRMIDTHITGTAVPHHDDGSAGPGEETK